jgi:3-hydroxyacyl-[acyl-carrier-protein] dehydratase
MSHSAEKAMDPAPGAPAAEAVTLDIQQIQQILPHRYPFLLIDRIIALEVGKRVTAIKSVTMNEPYFVGHFPCHPVMPGVLVVEAMAQAGGLLIMREFKPNSKLVLFTGIDDCKFRKQVTPGDQLRIEVEVLAFRRNIGRMHGSAYVDDNLACEAELSCMVIDRPASNHSAR